MPHNTVHIESVTIGGSESCQSILLHILLSASQSFQGLSVT